VSHVPGNGVSGPPWTVTILPFIEDDARFQSFNIKTGSFFGLYPGGGGSSTSEAAQQMIRNPKFECPSDGNSNGTLANSNYAGVMGGGASTDTWVCNNFDNSYTTRRGSDTGVLYNNSKIAFTDITDGTTNTFLIAETRYQQIYGVGYGNQYGATWASGFYWGGGPMHQNLIVTMSGINSSTLDPTTSVTHEVYTHTAGSKHAGGANFAMCDGSVHFIKQSIDLYTYQRLGMRSDGFPTGGFQP